MSNATNTDVKFRFLNFAVKESHIVLNQQGEFKINVDLNPKGFVFKALNQFHLEFDVEIKEESNKFHIKVIGIGIFEFDPNTNIEQYKSNYFTINAPAIVFPYIRAYISNLTTQSGLFTVTLPTFNLSGLAEALKSNITELE